MVLRKSVISFSILVLLITGKSVAQNFRVSGKITDTKGKAVVFVSVKVKNSDQGTSSDSLGIFNIKVKPNSTLLFSAIGFADTAIQVDGRNNLIVILRSQAKALQEVVVSGTNQNSGLPSPEEATREQIIASTFDNYLRGAEFSNGTFVVSGLNPAARGAAALVRTTISGFGALNTINSGAMLPVIEHKEETKGSRYLLNKYARGVIVDSGNHMITDSTNLLNYDKIDGQLMIARDAKNYLEVDKEKVIDFALKTDDTSFIFLNVPILSKVNYYLLIANGSKYSAYKSVRAKFVKSNYTSNGLVETGNNYDEYVDKQIYYWVDQKNEKAGIFELKKKSIKEAFASEAAKVDAYFSLHKHEDVDDNFVKNLIVFLNRG